MTTTDLPAGDSSAPSAPATEAAPSLGRSTASGFLWLFMQSMSGRVASFLSQLVLAKLLMPEMFGQVGLAYTVTTLVNAFISFGIDDILLQRFRTIYLWVSPAFWSSLIAALAGMALMLGAAPVAARMYGNPGLVGLVAVLAVTLPIGALSTVPMVKLRARMDFRFLGIYASVETVAIQAATVILAASGFGAYSFVLPLPFFAAIKVAVFWRKAPTRIRLMYRRVQLMHIMSSGFIVQATKILIEAVNQGDYIVLGLLANDATVGIYFFAFRLSAQPLTMLAGNFGSVLFPALTHLRGDRVRQEGAAIRASRILAYTVTPVCFLQAALAPAVLHLMFGAKWNAAVPLVQVLSLGLPGDATAWISGALLVARREFWRDFIYLLGFAVPFFLCVLAGAMLGSALGVAVAVALYYALLKPLNSWLIFRRSMTQRDFVTIYAAPPVIAGLAMGFAYGAANLPALSGHHVAQAVVIVLLGPPIYVLLLRLVVPTVFHEMQDRFPLHALFARIGLRTARRNA